MTEEIEEIKLVGDGCDSCEDWGTIRHILCFSCPVSTSVLKDVLNLN